MFSPAAISVAMDALYDFQTKPLNKYNSFDGYSVISLNKRHNSPSPEVFKDLVEAIFVTNFPFAQKVIETIIFVSILKPNRVTIAVKDIKNSNDAKTALFTVNQLEIPIIFLPTKNNNFVEIMKDITNEWLFDSRIKIDCYPVKQYFLSHVYSVLCNQGEEQSFVAKYCNHIYKHYPEMKKEIIQFINSVLPKEAIQDAAKKIK